MYLEPLEPRIKRRNLVLFLSLAVFIAVLVLLAINHISPEHAGTADSILSGMK